MKKKIVKLALLSAFVGAFFAGCSMKVGYEGSFSPAVLSAPSAPQTGGSCVK